MKHFFSYFITLIFIISGQYLLININYNQKQFWLGVFTARFYGTLQTELINFGEYAQKSVDLQRFNFYVNVPFLLSATLLQVILDLFLSSRIRKSYKFFLCENFILILLAITIFLSLALTNKKVFFTLPSNLLDYIDIVYNLENVYP